MRNIKSILEKLAYVKSINFEKKISNKIFEDKIIYKFIKNKNINKVMKIAKSLF
jgi:hypothetical protein